MKGLAEGDLSRHSSTGKQIGLALSGGAARGFAHVGVLGVLEREGIPIDCIAGVSAGSLVGAAYAGGIRGQRLLDMALRFRWRDIARPTRCRQGLVSFGGLEDLCIDTLGDVTFADLELPYAAVTADLETGDQVILTEGRVAPAVRASCSVPGVVAPVELNGRHLVDGGIVNNLPIEATRSLGADIVVAVTLCCPPQRHPDTAMGMLAAALDVLIWRAGDAPDGADICVSIPCGGFGSLLHTRRRYELLALGRRAAQEAIPALKSILG